MLRYAKIETVYKIDSINNFIFLKKMLLMKHRYQFNEDEDLGNVEKYKSLPNDLQNKIALYVDEVYNEVWNYTKPWYEIIENIGSYSGFEKIVYILNFHLSKEKKDCHQIGFIHKCNAFISCDECMKIGFHPVSTRRSLTCFWDDSCVNDMKATDLIMEKLNHYLYSDEYNPSEMFQVNKTLLEFYYDIPCWE